MYNLLDLYRRNSIFDTPISEVIEYAEKNQNEFEGYHVSGFWINNNYFCCVKDIFRRNGKILKKQTRCSQVMDTLLDKKSNINKCNCYTCLKECSEAYKKGILELL